MRSTAVIGRGMEGGGGGAVDEEARHAEGEGGVRSEVVAAVDGDRVEVPRPLPRREQVILVQVRAAVRREREVGAERRRPPRERLCSLLALEARLLRRELTGERVVGHAAGHHRLAQHAGEIAHSAHQPARHARRPAAAAGDLARTALVDTHAEQPGAPRDHAEQFILGVEVEPHRDAETVA